MTGSSVKLPRASVARAVTSAVRPKVGSSGRPRIVAWKKMLTKDRTPATTQVTDCSRPTGMPSMEARSRRSPTACTAIPTSLRVNHTDTAARQATETMTATRLLASKTDGSDMPGEVPGERDHRGGDGRLAPDAWDEQAQDDEELGEADGGDGQDEPGRAPEAPHHQDLDGGGEEERRHEAGGEPEEVVDAGEGDQADGQDGRGRAEVALGEVDHLVQAVEVSPRPTAMREPSRPSTAPGSQTLRELGARWGRVLWRWDF